MKTNIGDFDGWFRLLLFLASICLAILVGGYTWLLVIPGTILLVTSVLTWCPMYAMFGINKEM